MVGVGKSGWPAVLLGEPAIWTVPLAFLTMVCLSLATPRALPLDVTQKLLALHLPERVRPPSPRRAELNPEWASPPRESHKPPEFTQAFVGFPYSTSARTRSVLP